MSVEELRRISTTRTSVLGQEYYGDDGSVYVGIAQGELQLIIKGTQSSVVVGNQTISTQQAIDNLNAATSGVVGSAITQLTGDATAIGPGVVPITLATVNTNIGTFNTLTVNGKGLVTSAINTPYIALTALSALAPLQYNNVTGVFSITQSGVATDGYLSSVDWNTFNNKQNALTFGNLTDVGTDGIIVTGGTGAVIGAGTSLAQHVSDSTHNGYLSSTDWTTFNGKQPAGSYITGLTTDVTASGPGNVVATIASHAVTYAKMQQASTVTLLGNPTGGTANIQEITLGTGLSFSGSVLNAATSGGTVTSVSVVTNQGVSGSVATSTTTPAITLTLGALTGVTSFNGLIVTANTGVITTGTWNGGVIGATYGGTGQSVYAVGDVLSADTTTTLSRVADVATGSLFASGGVNTLPSWSTSPTLTTSLTVPLLIGGTGVGSNITYKSTTGTGTTTAISHQFLGGTNGATINATVYNDSQFIVGNATPSRNATSLGIFRVMQSTEIIDIGSLQSGYGAIWLCPTLPRTTSNYSIGSGSTSTYINCSTSTGAINLAFSGAVAHAFVKTGFTLTPLAVSSGLLLNFIITLPANLSGTATTELPSFKIIGGSQQWASSNSGTLTTQRQFYISSQTYTALSTPMTITNAYGFYVEAPTASTNITITNNRAAGFSGNIEVISGDAILSTLGKKLRYKTGSNAVMGTGTLVAGTATISTTAYVTGDTILLTDTGGGVLANIGSLYVSATSTGVSFTVTSTNVLDTSNFSWALIGAN